MKIPAVTKDILSAYLSAPKNMDIVLYKDGGYSIVKRGVYTDPVPEKRGDYDCIIVPCPGVETVISDVVNEGWENGYASLHKEDLEAKLIARLNR